jgi:hypothetical protein
MIKIELQPEDLQRKEVYDAFLMLIQALSENSVETIKATKKLKKVNAISFKQITDHLPEEIKQYEAIIKQPKCLTFLKIVFENQRISSDAVIESLQQYYQDISSKSIGGITGAITRWFEQHQLAVPYRSEKNKEDGIHWFIWG